MSTPLNPDEHKGDADRAAAFDEFARSAGSALREPAPAHGPASAVRVAKRQRATRIGGGVAAVALVGVGTLFIASRGDGVSERSGVPTTPLTAEVADSSPLTVAPTTTIVTSPTTTTAASTTTTTPASTVPPPTLPTTQGDPVSAAWVLNFTGSSPGSASGDPVRIGVYGAMNGADIRQPVVDYLNAEVGGIDGRPIELVTCTDTPEVCAATFVDDPSVIAVLDDTDQLNLLIGDAKPLIYSDLNPSPTRQFGIVPTPTSGQMFTATVLFLARETQPGDTIALVYAFVDEATIGYTEGLLPGRTVVPVVPTGEPLGEVMTAAGALEADAFFVIETTATSATCVQMADTVALVPAEAIVTTLGCAGLQGWYTLAYGYNLSEPEQEKGVLPIIRQAAAFGSSYSADSPANFLIAATRAAEPILLISRLVNELGGVDNADPQALSAALSGYSGPISVISGEPDCSTTTPTEDVAIVGVCARIIDVQQFVDGEWVYREPIDLRT